MPSGCSWETCVCPAMRIAMSSSARQTSRAIIPCGLRCDALLVRVHSIIVMIRWTGLAHSPRPAISPPRKGRRGAGRLPPGRSSERSGFDKKGRGRVGPRRNPGGHGGSSYPPSSTPPPASRRTPASLPPLPYRLPRKTAKPGSSTRATRVIGTGEQPQKTRTRLVQLIRTKTGQGSRHCLGPRQTEQPAGIGCCKILVSRGKNGTGYWVYLGVCSFLFFRVS